MPQRLTLILPYLFTLLFLALPALAQDGEQGKQEQQGPPPALVVTAPVQAGEVAPQSDFVGTVHFADVAEVAAEVEGKVLEVVADEGDEVAEGDVLVRLSSDLLEASINAARARLNQAQADYEFARLEAQRVESLYKSQSVAQGEWDSKRLGAKAALGASTASRADLKYLELELEKKTIAAPFDGMVTATLVDPGEWIAKGQAVATVARTGLAEVEVNVPAPALQAVKPGLAVTVKIGGRQVDGVVYAAIPKGDVATRSFPVKIRVTDTEGLADGMEAKVALPVGASGQTLIVPRDAVIAARGQLVVWAVLDGSAVPVPVEVMGYRGLTAGVRSLSPETPLAEGMAVVVKGNERLQPGQPVREE